MRIGRVGFVAGSLALLAIGAGAEVIGGWRPFGLDPVLATMGVRVACVIGWIAVVTWRCHDFNQTFWHAFWIDQVPFIGQFWTLWMLLATPGTEGMNSYGRPFPF